MPSENLCSLYRCMHRIRRVEEVIAELYTQQQMRCPMHLCIGQEATATGTCAQLEASDYVFSTHRSHGHYLAKGGSLEALLAELYGRATGCSMGKGGSMHLIDLSANFLGAAPILGATCALAVGAAFGTKLKGEKRVTVAFMGDAALEEGVVYEALNFAALKLVPVVLVCENNGLSTCSPLSVRQPAGRSLCDVARGIGLAAEAGDGNDVLDVCRQVGTAVQRARQGSGPTFLEFSTHRWREHAGPAYDFHLGYRSEKELETWKREDPLVRLKDHMTRHGLWDSAAMERMVAEVSAEIEQAVRAAQAAAFPAPEMLLAHEYAP